MVGCQVLSRPSAAEGGAAGQPLQDLPPSHTRPPRSTAGTAQPGVSKPGRSTTPALLLRENPFPSCASVHSTWKRLPVDARFRPDLLQKVAPSGKEGLNLFIEGGRINGEMYWGTSKVPQLPGISARGWAGLLGASSRIENIAASLLPQSIFPSSKFPFCF